MYAWSRIFFPQEAFSLFSFVVKIVYSDDALRRSAHKTPHIQKHHHKLGILQLQGASSAIGERLSFSCRVPSLCPNTMFRKVTFILSHELQVLPQFAYRCGVIAFTAEVALVTGRI